MRAGHRLEIEFKDGKVIEVIAEAFGRDFFSYWKGTKTNGYRDTVRVNYDDCRVVRDLDENFTTWYEGRKYYKTDSEGYYPSLYDDSEYPRR